MEAFIIYDEFHTMTREDWDRILLMVRVGGRWFFNHPPDEREWLLYQHASFTTEKP